jgi:hypothetical protein
VRGCERCRVWAVRKDCLSETIVGGVGAIFLSKGL